MTFVPGEGMIVRTPSGSSWSKSFVGEVAQGHGVNPVPNQFSMRSSIIPQGGRVVTDLKFPAINGDKVQLMVNGTYQTYELVGGVWSPSEPVVAIGDAFWSQKNVGFWWHRNFLVWP